MNHIYHRSSSGLINSNHRNWIVPLFIFVYFFLTGFTQPAGEAGQGILGRLIPADIFMFGLAICGLGVIKRIHFPPEYSIYLVFILTFGLTGFFSSLPRQAFIELLVHIWAWLGSLVLFNILAVNPERGPKIALNIFLVSSAFLAILGLLQLYVFPNMLSGKTVGGVVGSFRNAGQAGSYFGLAMAIIIPAFLTGYIKFRSINLILAMIIFIALVMTTKRAAMVGFAIGYVGLLVLLISYGGLKYKKYAFFILFVSFLAAPVLYYVIAWGTENIQSMSWRLERKLGENSIENFSEGFFRDNISSAFAAFSNHPFTGVGLGNVAGVYTPKYEIHSTYFKIIATGGILGTLAYLSFMLTWARNFLSSIGTRSREATYLLYFSPFLVGLLISWIYTYHLRKREFWIAFAIVVLITRVAIMKKKWFNKTKLI